jgi:hypothetical protein
VSSISDANTVFEGQEIGHRAIERLRDRHRKKRDRRENTADKRRYTEIKTLKRDNRTDNRKEIKGPLRDMTSEGHNTL